MEKDKEAAVNKQAATDFEEKQKLRSMVQDLQRRLEKQTADQLGEGAELDLFEALKAAFEDDRIGACAKARRVRTLSMKSCTMEKYAGTSFTIPRIGTHGIAYATKLATTR